MSAPASSPERCGPRRTAQGTIVGMPPVIQQPVRLGQLCSTTLRSVYAPEDAPNSDAFHPERWSNPPPIGLAPIVPCPEPEEDEPVQVFPRLEPTPAPESVVLEAHTADSAEDPDPPEPPTERWQPKAASVPQAVVPLAAEARPAESQAVAPQAVAPQAEEPIVLPFRERDPAPTGRLLLVAALTSATLLLAIVAALVIWA